MARRWLRYLFDSVFPHGLPHKGPRAQMWDQYSVGMYWGVTALKGTTEAARTNIEMWCGILVTVIGGAVYAIMIGDVANVFTNLDEAGNAFKKTIDNLNMYMDENHFESELQFKLRGYFFHCKTMLRGTITVSCDRCHLFSRGGGMEGQQWMGPQD